MCLVAFAKQLRKPTISFMSVHLFVCSSFLLIEQCDSHRSDFHEILCVGFLRKFATTHLYVC